MAKRPDITTVTSGYTSQDTINTNFENVRDQFDNTLSRDGSTPNTMDADFDMNSNDILNANEVNTKALKINGEAVAPTEFVTDKLAIEKEYETVADLLAATDTFAIDKYVKVVDGDFTYKVVASGGDVQNSATTPVEFDVIPVDGEYVPQAFGATGDGVADDTTFWDACVTAAGSDFTVVGDGIYNVSSEVGMPLLMRGNFTIDGDVKWSFKKKCSQEGRFTATGNITIDSIWDSRFFHLDCTQILFESTNSQWGNFWNDFGLIRCTSEFIIDVDQGQSTNQNNFQMVKAVGGVRIRGTNTTGTREAHSNTFYGLDTTGANMTAADGSTGLHVVNESDLNQTNHIQNFYAEATGNRTVRGNWNILGDMVDANTFIYEGKRENYRLGSRVQGRQSSFLPMPALSLAEGSDWGTLNGVGRPPSMSGLLSTVQLSSVSTSARNSPDFSIQGAQSVGGGTFRAIDISYKLTDVSRVHATAFVYQEGDPETSIEILDASGSVVTSGAGSYTPLGNNWYLLRISGNGDVIDRAAGDLEGKIRIYTTQGTALTASDFRIITSFFVTTESIAPLPSIHLGRKECVSSSVPTNGQWNLGDITWDDTPVNGNNIGVGMRNGGGPRNMGSVWPNP